MKIIGTLIDKINEDDLKDEAEAEGGESRMTSQTAYYDCVDKVMENMENQTGVVEFGLASGSKEQHQLVACFGLQRPALSRSGVLQPVHRVRKILWR